MILPSSTIFMLIGVLAAGGGGAKMYDSIQTQYNEWWGSRRTMVWI